MLAGRSRLLERPARQPIGRVAQNFAVLAASQCATITEPDRGSLLLFGHLLIRSSDAAAAAVHHRMLRCSS